MVLRTALAAASGGFSLVSATGDFVRAVAVAAVIGWAVGLVTVAVRHRLDDPVLTTTVSLAVPFLAYVPAEELHASGVLAVVVAGLMSGTLGSRFISAADRRAEATNFATVQFVLENAVFLVMGMQLPDLVRDVRGDGRLSSAVLLTGVVVALLVLTRGAGVGLTALVTAWRESPARIDVQRSRLDQVRERLEADDFASDRISPRRREHFSARVARADADVRFAEREPFTRRGAVVISWAGMRGVVTLAAALTIEPTQQGRASVVLIAALSAVCTLVLFGGSMGWVIDRMGFEGPSAVESRVELRNLMNQIAGRAVERLGPIAEFTVDDEPLDPRVAERLAARFGPVAEGRPAPDAADPTRPPSPGNKVLRQSLVAQRAYLDAMRDALNDERSIGAFRTASFTRAEQMLDQQETLLDAAQA